MPTNPAGGRPKPGLALLAATLLTLPIGAIYAFSVFLVPLEQLLSVSRSELASVFGISVITFTIGMNVVPRLFDLWSVPVIVALSSALCAGGVALAAAAPSFTLLALGYGVIFSFGGGLAYVGLMQCVNATPISRPGLVNGYLVSLLPLGAMLAAPSFGWGIDVVGVRMTLAGLAVVLAVLGAASSIAIAASGVRLTPSAVHAATASTGVRPAERSGTVATPSTRIIFWQLFITFLMAATSGLMVLSQAAAIFIAYGAETKVALAATTAITAGIAAARIGGGWLLDRLPVPVVGVIAQAIALAGAILLSLVPTADMAIPALGMIGIGYGLVSGLTAGAIAMFWPKHLFGRTASRIYIAWCLAALILPVIAARLFDLTGGYGPAVILAGSANLVGLLVSFTLPRQRTAAKPTPNLASSPKLENPQ